MPYQPRVDLDRPVLDRLVLRTVPGAVDYLVDELSRLPNRPARILKREPDRLLVEYAGPLRNFEVTPRSDRMVRAVIDLCHREGIAVSLLIMAEGSDFRALYSKAAQASIRDYTAGLCREYAIGVIDARDWMPDDAFFDGHHLLPGSAADFSRRLAAMLEKVWEW